MEGFLEKDSCSDAFLEMWLETNAKLSGLIKPSGCGEGVSICAYTACV